MQIQVNSNNSVIMNENLIRWAADDAEKALDRFADKITRVEILLDEEVNSDRGGLVDKYCTIEACVDGMQPMVSNHKARSFDQALAGAAEKLEQALCQTMGLDDSHEARASRTLL